MKVILEMSLEQFKKHSGTYSESAYIPAEPKHAALLLFHEYHYECGEDCKGATVSGRLCCSRVIKPNNSSTAFKVVGIEP